MEQTIAAIATPHAVGGIAVIRISGECAMEIAQKVFESFNGKTLTTMQGYTAAYGKVVHPITGEAIDTGVALVYRAPKSYTGEDVVELSCHGGILVTEEVLRAVLAAGARMAGAGEFTQRAFLNGKMDLTQAEAVIDLINSTNDQARRIAKAQLDGKTAQKIAKVKQELLELTAKLAVWADYPEEDLEEPENQSFTEQLSHVKKELQRMLDRFYEGSLLKNGINTVIVGKPNVGKSTLMNLLAQSQKSIVTNVPGTTRDVVEDTVVLKDVVLKLSDTAGIRTTHDLVEQIGVERAVGKLKTANLALMIFDSSQQLSQEDYDVMTYIADVPSIAIVNKADLNCQIEMEEIQKRFKNVLYISANEEDAFDKISELILKVLQLENFDLSLDMAANERQRDCIERAFESTQNAEWLLKQGMTYDAVTIELEEAAGSLLELTGERVTEAVVQQVFAQFCVGK